MWLETGFQLINQIDWLILFLSLTGYMLWKKVLNSDAHDIKHDNSVTYMA